MKKATKRTATKSKTPAVATKPRRYAYWPAGDAPIPGQGWRLSIVYEGERGHHPTGQWPNDGTGVMPYFLKGTWDQAVESCYELNSRHGVDRETTRFIITESIKGYFVHERDTNP